MSFIGRFFNEGVVSYRTSALYNNASINFFVELIWSLVFTSIWLEKIRIHTDRKNKKYAVQILSNKYAITITTMIQNSIEL